MNDRGASQFETKPVRVPGREYDVAILGGGLAGLSLAIQLMLVRPQTRVLVTEKRPNRRPRRRSRSASRASRSGRYYYRNRCGMADHLDQKQLRKLGLRFFLPAGDNSDITRRVEFCTPPPTRRSARTRSIAGCSRTRSSTARSNAGPTRSAAGARRTSSSAPLQARDHAESRGHDETVAARWVVDATGRSTSCDASSASEPRQATTSTPRGSGSRAGWTSRTGQTTRSGSAGRGSRASARARRPISAARATGCG